MAIKKLSYLDIPQSVRRERASGVMQHYRSLLSSRTSQERRDEAKAQLQRMHAWVNGNLEELGSNPPPPAEDS